jgi:hypothetical protein
VFRELAVEAAGAAGLKDGRHPDLGACRVNLSFRKAR